MEERAAIGALSIEVDHGMARQVEKLVDFGVGSRSILLVGVEKLEVFDVELRSTDLDLLGDLGGLGYSECISAPLLGLESSMSG